MQRFILKLEIFLDVMDQYVIPGGWGFSKDFIPQMTKIDIPLFTGSEGAVAANEWCINTKRAGLLYADKNMTLTRR